MRKTLLIVVLLLIFGGMLSCAHELDKSIEEPYVRPEQPHLYWKDIDVVVIDVTKRRSLGKYQNYTVELEVSSDEYGITGNCRYSGRGMFGVPHQWTYEAGQIVKAKLNSWVMDSTGEVIRREIVQVY